MYFKKEEADEIDDLRGRGGWVDCGKKKAKKKNKNKKETQ